MPADQPLPCTTVLYDGSCPLCLKEISLYQQLKPLAAVQWLDVSAQDTVLPEGASRERLMQRFHVQMADGTLLVGAAAFVHLWRQLPGWRHVATITRLPGVVRMMDWGYVWFLRWRPQLQRWVRRRALQRKGQDL